MPLHKYALKILLTFALERSVLSIGFGRCLPGESFYGQQPAAVYHPHQACDHSDYIGPLLLIDQLNDYGN